MGKLFLCTIIFQLFAIALLGRNTTKSRGDSIPITSPKPRVYAEIFGRGGWGSVNVELPFGFTNQRRHAIAAGVGVPLSDILYFPFSYSFFAGKKQQFEFGNTYLLGYYIGEPRVDWPRRDTRTNLAIIGYRKHFRRTFLSVRWTPLYENLLDPDQRVIYPGWGSLSFGVRF